MKNNVMQRLFSSFEKNNINYIHFKSNTNIYESFAGNADFDVLVEKNQILMIETIILEHKGKQHNPRHIGAYPGVDNWLLFNNDDGTIYHLHLHYQLATGKPLVKDYIIPWTDFLFSSRVKDPKYDIYITDPSLELLLLAVRSVLKSKTFDFPKKLLGLYKLSNSLQKEWDDLYLKSDKEKVVEYINSMFPNHSSLLNGILTKQKLLYWDYIKLHRIIRADMELNRRYGGFEATIRSWFYRFEDIISKIWSRKMGGFSITKKISLQGGLIIAFVGVDGAGKSTVSNEISRWIGRKIECRRLYMGTGDGKTTLFASILKIINVRLGYIRKEKTNNPTIKSLDNKNEYTLSLWKNPFSYLKKLMKVFLILNVEKNNVRKIKKMHKYRLNGGITILDRYPQIEINGQNDGLKIPGYKRLLRSSLVSKLEDKEKNYLTIVKYIKPDVVFRLNISAETGLKRKIEHKDIAFHQRKISELNELHFQGAKIIEVDAEKSYELEILEIKRELWKYI